MNYPHPILAREGWPFIAGSVLLAAMANWWWGWAPALPLDIIAVFVIQFFRDPPRQVPTEPNAVLSPADGRIVKVEKAFDPYPFILLTLVLSCIAASSSAKRAGASVR